MGILKGRRFDPCFGFYLKGAVLWICYMNILIDISLSIFWMRIMYDPWHTLQQEKQENHRLYITHTNFVRHVASMFGLILTPYFLFLVRVCIWASLWSHLTIGLSFDLYILKESRLRNVQAMFLWMVGTFLNMSWVVISYYFNTFYFGIHVETITVFNGYVIYRGYTSLVVYSYMKEIKEELNSLKNCRNLTDEEIQEFETGLKQPHQIINVHDDLHQQEFISGNNDGHCISESRLSVQVQYERYKKEDYEISTNDLLIDEAQILGAGAFGKVYRGQLFSFHGSSEKLLVAVKTINCENSDVYLFKTLLSELKIMSYLGKHDHIVSLMGACTAEIKYKKLFLVVEFCAFGSLYDYLRCNLGLFFSQVKDHVINNTREIEYGGAAETDITTTKDLLKWCYQTADGMAYLESKKVIHGDLAARNILLTSEKNVKITDFGLSRRLYHYDVYAKTQITPLPWRWLALESITDMNFSSKSDVWAFGTTVWEIFSMGEAPWADKSFTSDFIRELKNGMRLTIPTNCTNVIYNMLLHCWNIEPNRRPSFALLNEFFKTYYNYLV